ncbi:hypothetical protein FQN57_003294 [Myotisia sp. PD_48]|nr:hypothetical protein FQN57_003294 [Myotisia sp. PD_48]
MAYYRMEQEYTTQQPPYRQQSIPGPTTPMQISPTSRKRPLAPPISERMPSSAPSAPRAIQPKPSVGGERFSAPELPLHMPISRMPEQHRQIGPRKRGRPSKADVQKRLWLSQQQQSSIPAPRPSISRPYGPTVPGMHPSPFPSGPTLSPHSPVQLTEPLRQTNFQPRGPPELLGPQSTQDVQDIQVRRPPRPQPRMESGIFQDPPPESKEATPRTLPDVRLSPTSMAPPIPSSSEPTESPSISTRHEVPVCGDETSPVQTNPNISDGKGP